MDDAGFRGFPASIVHGFVWQRSPIRADHAESYRHD
jgi:hypothetical protein